MGVHGNGYSFVFTWGKKQQNLKKQQTGKGSENADFIRVFKCSEDSNRVLMNATNDELSIGNMQTHHSLGVFYQVTSGATGGGDSPPSSPRSSSSGAAPGSGGQ